MSGVFVDSAPNGLKISQSCPMCLTHQRLQQECRNFSYPQVETITVRDGAGTAAQNVEKRWFEGFYHSRAIKKMHKTQMYFLFRSHLLPLVICTSSWKKKAFSVSAKAHRILSTCVRKWAGGPRTEWKKKLKVDLWMRGEQKRKIWGWRGKEWGGG